MRIEEDQDDTLLSNHMQIKLTKSQKNDERNSRRSVIRRVASQSLSSAESNQEKDRMLIPNKKVD